MMKLARTDITAKLLAKQVRNVRLVVDNENGGVRVHRPVPNTSVTERT